MVFWRGLEHVRADQTRACSSALSLDQLVVGPPRRRIVAAVVGNRFSIREFDRVRNACPAEASRLSCNSRCARRAIPTVLLQARRTSFPRINGESGGLRSGGSCPMSQPGIGRSWRLRLGSGALLALPHLSPVGPGLHSLATFFESLWCETDRTIPKGQKPAWRPRVAMEQATRKSR